MSRKNAAGAPCAARSVPCLIGSHTNELPLGHPDIPTMNAPALGHRPQLHRSLRPRRPCPSRCGFRGWLQDGECRGACAPDGGARRAGAACGQGRIQSADRAGASARGFHRRPVRRDRARRRALRAAHVRWRRSTTASACSCSATSRARSRPLTRRWRSTAPRSRRRRAAGADRGRARSLGACFRAEPSASCSARSSRSRRRRPRSRR